MEQYEFLKEMGYDFARPFLFSLPMPSQGIEELCRQCAAGGVEARRPVS